MFRLGHRFTITALCWLGATTAFGQYAAPPPAAESAPPAAAEAAPPTTTEPPDATAAAVASPSSAAAPQPAASAPPSTPIVGPPASQTGTPPASDVAAVSEASPGEAPVGQSFEGDAWGDEPASLVAGPMSLRVLLQTRYRHTFAANSSNTRPGYALREDVLVRDGDGFGLERFFLRIAADPTPLLGFKAILDFSKLRGSDVSNVLKQAYATLRPLPDHIEIAAGIFKLPFSILELDPVARYELSSLGDADDVIKNLGFAGRDVGVEIMLAPLPKPKLLRLMLGAFRGHAKDEHASPVGALGARVESKPWKGLRVGIDVVGMPQGASYKQPFETSNKDVLPMPPDPLYPREQRFDSGKAYSADVTFSRFRLTLRAEGMLGDRVDIDRRYGARSFWAAWAVVAYRFRAGPVRLMPAARIEWLDVDREHAVGRRRLLSLGLNVLFTKTIRLLVDVTHTDVEGNTPVVEQPLPLAVFPYLELDNTRVVAQLQLEY
jgi:hypothetical protein